MLTAICRKWFDENRKFTLNIDDNIQKDLNSFEHIAQSDKAIDQKLNELISLLSESNIDSERAKEFQQRFNQAVERSVSYRSSIQAFQKVNKNNEASREEMLDEFSMLLSSHQLDSKASSQYIKHERMSGVVLIIISIVLITLGFAMIVMPAPPYFEMFTIFYFNPDDGVTLMDLISLLIILTGIYLFIRALTKKLSLKK